MEPKPPDSSNTQYVSPDASVSAKEDSCGCDKCTGRASYTQQFAYVVGRLDVRFPSLGIEREYQQRERALPDLQSQPRSARMRAVLERNPHLALRVGWILQIQSSPAYALLPSTGALKNDFFEALVTSQATESLCVAIGRVGPVTSPSLAGGLLLPTLLVDQLYSFSIKDWAQGLHSAAAPVLTARKIDADHFQSVAQNVFREIVFMPENLGVTDGHRALNYLLVQHPGVFLAAAERRGHKLDRIETRITQAMGTRRHVAVILTFLDLATGVPERLYCSVDVTEEWPFMAGAEGGIAPLGMAPYIETAVSGSF